MTTQIAALIATEITGNYVNQPHVPQSNLTDLRVSTQKALPHSVMSHLFHNWIKTEALSTREL